MIYHQSFAYNPILTVTCVGCQAKESGRKYKTKKITRIGSKLDFSSSITLKHTGDKTCYQVFHLVWLGPDSCFSILKLLNLIFFNIVWFCYILTCSVASKIVWKLSIGPSVFEFSENSKTYSTPEPVKWYNLVECVKPKLPPKKYLVLQKKYQVTLNDLK